jgi:DUF4097 and DUF4098 domain-containing protein YvlB
MRVNLALWVLAPALLHLTGCDIEDFAGGRYNQDFHYSYPLKAGGKVSIETFNGAIELDGWDQNSVDISGTKYGPSQEAAAALRVDVENNPDSIEVRVIRPTDFHGSRGARFTVRMPRTALLDHITSSNGAISVMGGSGPSRFRTSNGSIHVQAFEGNLDARTSNGSIELIDVAGEVVAHTSNARIRAEDLKGPLDAGTSNGGITATLAQVTRPVRLETSNSGVDLTLPSNFASGVRVTTSNGHITLHMPGPVNAQVVAHTNNASITSDFDVKVQGALNKNHLDGTIGAGGPLIELNTSNSPIRLLRM